MESEWTQVLLATSTFRPRIYAEALISSSQQRVWAIQKPVTVSQLSPRLHNCLDNLSFAWLMLYPVCGIKTIFIATHFSPCYPSLCILPLAPLFHGIKHKLFPSSLSKAFTVNHPTCHLSFSIEVITHPQSSHDTSLQCLLVRFFIRYHHAISPMLPLILGKSLL